MKKLLFLLLALSLGLNAGMLYVRFADRPGGGPAPPPERPGHGEVPSPEILIAEHLATLKRHLQLDATQIAAIRAILEREMPVMQELHRLSFDARREIARAFAAPEFDEARFLAMVARVDEAQSRTDSLSAVMLIAEARHLTASQRARLADVAPTSYSQPGPPSRRNGPGPGHPPGETRREPPHGR